MPTLLPALLVALLPQSGERMSAQALVDEAWRFLPAYEGAHRPFLTVEQRRDTTVGAHLLEAAVALEPEHLRGLWSLGHARILLAEDRRNRGELEEARMHFAHAERALSDAVRLDPGDPWAAYALGAARTAFGRNEEALVDLDRALVNADAQLAQPGDHGSVPWLRFKILEWRGEVLMRAGRFAQARKALQAFHDEFSDNRWPGLIAQAECHLRERDLAGARERYLEILPLFPSDHQAYALLGYVAGLLGDRETATRRLQEAIENELEPGFYTRLWLRILATDEVLPAAAADLRAFVAHAPQSLSEWDRTLGRFVVGELTADEFLASARAEVERRTTAAEALDDLMCEVWYYVGLRLESDAAAVEGAERDALLARALDAYRSALTARPVVWKWEWAFARAAFARLAPDGAAPDTLARAAATGGDVEVLDERWHVPGTPVPVAELGRAPRAGDLRMRHVRLADGSRTYELHVVGVP